ncbi:hypothetical protein EDB87DRAFT_1044671 [Lactarius vividus]|nr:hypothetical protein EDB87DRAFT_1044671 [Lactarius vividus]
MHVLYVLLCQSWTKFLAEGIKHLQRQDIDEAIKSFDKAISLANDKFYVLHDSRASAYENKNFLKDALLDAKKTIDVSPKQWHGYFRSARLFAALGQIDNALGMCSLALERLGGSPKHEARRHELTDLSGPGSKDQIRDLGYASRATLDNIPIFEQPRHHFSRLPSIARDCALTAHILAFLSSRGPCGESPS